MSASSSTFGKLWTLSFSKTKLSGVFFVVPLVVNECQENTHNCDTNALCHDRTEGFSCVCIDGYNGNGFTCAGEC